MSNTNPPADHPFVEEQTPGKRLEDNVRSRTTWTRFVFMAISFVLLWLASIVGIVIIGFGFLWVLITGEVNRELREVGQSLASYVYENIRYLTFNTDDRPFPFGNKWPASDLDEE
jgi:hypothetical protein